MALVKCLVTVCLLFVLFSRSQNRNTRLDVEQCHSQFHSCFGQQKEKLCRCDSLCQYFDDCCYDTNKITDLSSQEVHKQPEFGDRTSCIFVNYGKLFNVNKEEGTFMVSSCPDSLNVKVDLRYKCESNVSESDVTDNLPVTEKNTNVTFKNRHCAKCNKVQNWVPWNLETHCGLESFLYKGFRKPYVSLYESVQSVVRDSDCGYRFVPPEFAKTRTCFRHFDYNVRSELPDVTNSTCHGIRILKPVMYINDTYRNIHCVIETLNLSLHTVLDNIGCFLTSDANKLYNGRITKWTLITVLYMTSLFKTGSDRCDDEKIYLSDKGMCHRLYCPINTVPYGGGCRNVVSSTDGKILDLLFDANEVLNLKTSNIVSAFNHLLRNILALLGDCNSYPGQLYVKKKMVVDVFLGKNITTNKSCSFARVRFPLKREGGESSCTTEQEKYLVFKAAEHYRKTFYPGHTIMHVNDVTESTCRTKLTLSNPMYIMDQYWSGTYLPCPAVHVNVFGGNTSDLTHLQKTSTGNVFFDLNGTLIDHSDIVYYNNEFYLCVATYLSKYQKLSGVTVIVIVCNSLSILGLICCLVRYGVIPVIRDGKFDLILMMFSFSLLYHVSLLVVYLKKVSLFCEWFGMLHHFAWFGCFVFLFLCSYRLYEEIRNPDRFASSEKSVQYVCVGLAVNVVIVVSTKLISVYHTSSENWYGGEMCFITNTSVLFLTFILPISFMLYGTRIVFGRIITYTLTSSVSSPSRKQTSKLIVFMEITVLLVCMWIFEIGVLLYESDIMLTIFEYAASLHGTVLTVSLVCNYCDWK